ncbi:MAG TPA: oligosaccharide flippase family protein [Ferruginibacter sp.]|nr:oligosaccharide flippase family protein [Ferruginibacter sp.]
MSLPKPNLIRSTLVYVAIGFLPVAANFLLAPVYTKFLKPDEYALIGLATLFQTFLTFFLSLSLDGAFSRIYFDYEKKPALKHAVLSTLIISVILISAIVFGLLFLLGNQLFSLVFTNQIFRFTNFGYWVVINTFCNIIFLFFALLYRNEEKLRKFTALNLLFFFIPVVGTLTGLMLFDKGALGAIIGRSIASLLFIVVLLGLYFKMHKPVIKTSYLKKALKFSLPLIPYQLMFAGFSNLDRFILERNFTLHDFGVYNFAVMVTGLVPVFLNALSNATNPRIFRELANNGNLEIVRKYNYLNLFFSTAVICISVAAVVPTMRLLINKDYSDSYIYFGTLFLSFLPYLHYLIYNVPLFYFGKTGAFPVIAFFALISGIIFNKLFIPYLGIWSVCLSLYAIRIIQGVVAYGYIKYYKYDSLIYVKQLNGLCTSFIIIGVYNFLLWGHYKFDISSIDVINLTPLVLLILIGPFFYKNETAFLLKHVFRKSL